jgi:glycosyltransferase involved in cell wall biosynthesis
MADDADILRSGYPALAGRCVLQVIPDLAAGGAERTTVEIAEALSAAGAEALVASAGGRLEPDLQQAGGELVRFRKMGSKSPIDLALNAMRLEKLIRERNVALVHARSRAPAWSALRAARAAGVPFVTTYHGIYSASGKLKRAYNSVMARGDAVIANSAYTAGHVRAEFPEAASRIVTIPRGVDLNAFRRDAVSDERRAAIIRDWRLKPGRPLIILLPGRLTAWKGQRIAIDAAKLLARMPDLPKWQMIFAGDAQGRDDYAQGLNAAIREADLEDRIALVGHCDDMPAALALADIVLAPSTRAEAFGRVAAEAGAMGVPVIGSDLGGQKEVIRNGETGLLTPPGQAPPLHEALAGLILAGQEGRRAMGKAAEIWIRQRYSTLSLQSATLSVYQSLLTGTA